MKRSKSIILAILLVIVIGVAGVSYARYVGSVTGSANVVAAKWAINVNNDSLTSSTAQTFTNDLSVTIEENANVVAGKVAPGTTGYFVIEIDPNATEVAFDYTIALGAAADLPAGMSITGYKVNDGDLQNVTEGTFTNTMALPSGNAFTTADKQTVKVFVTWANEEDNNGTDTTTGVAGSSIVIPVEVTVSQKVA